jgi:hypothetical protein
MWKPIYVCTECEHELTRSELLYSRACCPYCGHMSGNIPQILKFKTQVVEYEPKKRIDWSDWGPCILVIVAIVVITLTVIAVF